MLSKKYQSAIETSTVFMGKIEDLVREIAIQNGIPYYRIESQMEHNPHMNAEDVYMPVIRIITYFEDTVSKVVEILHNEFDIIQGKSIDKKKNRLDSFSYKHVQYIGNLKANRRELTEYKRCGDKKFEIQLCSMLQDAWSGIEKVMGYDTAAFPAESKRDFYRVGALLEMADMEFLKMRTENGKRVAASTAEAAAAPQHHEVKQEAAQQPIVTPVAQAAQPVNTFEDHLRAVVYEVPAPPVVSQVAAQPAPQPQAPVYVAPVVEYTQPIINQVAAQYAAPVQEAAQPIVNQIVTEAAPYVAPVAEYTQPVINHVAAQYAAPVQEAAQPIINQVIAQPEAAPYAAPVVEYIAPVVNYVAAQPEAAPYVAPVQETIAAVVNNIPAIPTQEEITAPVTEATNHTLNTVAASFLAPQRAMPVEEPAAAPAPVAAPAAFGIAPQRVTLAAETDINMNVDQNGTLAITNPIENPAEHIAEIVNVGSLVEQPIPAPQEEPLPVISMENILSAPIEIAQPIVVAETIAPIVNNIESIVPEIHIPKTNFFSSGNTTGININGASGRTPDEIREQLAAASGAPEKAPLVEDAQPVHAAASRPVALDENAPMSDASLKEFVIKSTLLKEIDMRIAERAGAKINSEIDIEGDVERLRFLKVFTLKQLQDRLTDNKNDIVTFAEKWIGKDNGGSFDSGISLFYLEYLLVGKKNDPAFAIEYVVKFISDNDYSARYIIPTYNSIRNSDAPTNNFAHLTLRA